MNNFLEIALEKLDSERKAFKGNQIQKTVLAPVADAIKTFCKQDPEFAQAVAQSEKTLSQCCEEITKDVNQSNCTEFSGVKIYLRAAKFYFITASISVEMRIDTCGDIDAAGAGSSSPSDNKIISISLDDLFD